MNRWWLQGTTSALLATGCLMGCTEPTPQERVARLRSLYHAELTGFVVKQDPVLAAASGDDEAAQDPPQDPEPAPEAAAEADADPPEPDAPADSMAPIATSVSIDVLISTEATEKLPFLTLDFSQAHPDGTEKEHRLVEVDTSAVERGSGNQILVVLEDIHYVAGDGFHVEVRSPVPPEERHRYREFQMAPEEG